MATLDSPPVNSDEQQVAEDLAFRRRMVHQADLEQKRQDNNAFRGLGVTPHDIFEINGELHEGKIKFPSMEPFCGEGRKP